MITYFPYFPIKNHDHDDHLIIFHTFHGKLHEFSIIFRFLGHSIPFQPAQPTLGGDSGDCCCSAARRGADIATGTVYLAGPARLTGRWGAIGRSGCETGELGLKLWKIYENLWYHLVICYIAMENPSEREQTCILFIFKKEATCSHLPLAATCSHLQQVAATGSHLADTCSSGCSKWLPSGCQVAASGCKWLLFRKSKWCTFARSLGEPLFWLVKSRCNLTMILILLDTIDLGVYSGTQPALHGTYRHAQLDEHLSDCIDRYTVNTKNRRLEFHQSYFSMSP